MSVISKAEFARTAGVAAPSISELLKKGRLSVTADKRMDTEDPLNAAYLSRRRSVANGETLNPATYSTGAPPPNQDEDHYQPPTGGAGKKSPLEWDLAIKQQKHAELLMKNAARAGTLLEKQQLLNGFYYPVDQLFGRLLTDCVRSAIGLIVPQVRAGATEAEAEEILRKQMENFIKACKKQMKEFYQELAG